MKAQHDRSLGRWQNHATAFNGLKSPKSGGVKLEGIDLHHADSQILDNIRNQRMGFVYQTHYLFKDFNALENVALAAKINQLSFIEAKAKAFACMESIEIGHLADKNAIMFVWRRETASRLHGQSSTVQISYLPMNPQAILTMKILTSS